MTPSKRIKSLDPVVVHRIAAGEVIEAPYSVIKELLENSIDSGARKIEIFTSGGGLRSIIIKDNGCGIHSEDISLAVEKHATSKIKEVADLESILSFGFRGEALASINSISKLTIASRLEEEKNGRIFSFVGGTYQNDKALAMNRGTNIEVNDLFFNTPVRRKFLAKERAENEKIKSTIIKSSLTALQTSFTYYKENKKVFHLQAVEKLNDRLDSIWNENFSENFYSLSYTQGSMQVHGFISKANFYRGNRSLQYFFVNNRPVDLKWGGKILQTAYRELIPSGQFPLVFLFFTIDPLELDVNVHPTKKELRFLDELQFNGFFSAALNNCLKGKLPDIFTSSNSFKNKKAPFSNTVNLKNSSGKQMFFAEQNVQSKRNSIPSQRSSPLASKDFRYSSFVDKAKKFKSEFTNEANLEQADSFKNNSNESYKEIPFSNEEESLSLQRENDFTENLIENQSNDLMNDEIVSNENESLENRLFFKRHFGLLFDTFILAEGSDTLYLIDQHTAHERIRFEQLLNDLQKDNLNSSKLLSPVWENLLEEEMILFTKYQSSLSSGGIKARQTGPNQVGIFEVPFYIEAVNVPFVFRSILQIWKEHDEIGKQELQINWETFYRDSLADKACKSAIKSGDTNSEQIISDMLKDLENCKEPERCPHGRPVYIKISRSELEKLFMR